MEFLAVNANSNNLTTGQSRYEMSCPLSSFSSSYLFFSIYDFFLWVNHHNLIREKWNIYLQTIFIFAIHMINMAILTSVAFLIFLNLQHSGNLILPLVTLGLRLDFDKVSWDLLCQWIIVFVLLSDHWLSVTEYCIILIMCMY